MKQKSIIITLTCLFLVSCLHNDEFIQEYFKKYPGLYNKELIIEWDKMQLYNNHSNDYDLNNKKVYIFSVIDMRKKFFYAVLFCVSIAGSALVLSSPKTILTKTYAEAVNDTCYCEAESGGIDITSYKCGLCVIIEDFKHEGRAKCKAPAGY